MIMNPPPSPIMQISCRFTLIFGLSIFLSACVSATAVEKPALRVAVRQDNACVFLGDGTPTTWGAMVGALVHCDAVFIGETHDDAYGHALEAQLVGELIAAWHGGALSIEMLERDEQKAADQWRAGEIDSLALAQQTKSESWAGKNSWVQWYQPVLDAAKLNGGVVIAANAPRKYVRMVSKDGMKSLPPVTSEERALFDAPCVQHPEYREDLRAVMVEMRQEDGQPTPIVSDEDLDRFLASQLMWDATMARSVAKAREKFHVVHIAGCFHIDRSGATVAEFKALRPSDTVATVSLVSSDTCEFDFEKDIKRAAFVVYTQSHHVSDGADLELVPKVFSNDAHQSESPL